MTRLSARAAAVVAGALALPVLGAAPATAATCSTSDGVSVVVDFGGRIKTGCAAGDPASAWAALQASGFWVEGTQRFPTTFVCRVDGFPAPAQEACIQTPPASAYWALWSAPAGGSWSYSTQGAATLNPAPGTAIGLAFGAGASPGMAPPAPTQPTTSTTRPPTTSTTTPSPTKPGPSSTTRRPTSTTSPAGGTSTTGPAGPTASGSPDRTDASGPASDDPSVDASDPVALPQVNASTTGAPTATTSAQPAAAPASAQPSGTNPALVVGGGAAIALLLVGGAIVVRRQRDRALRE